MVRRRFYGRPRRCFAEPMDTLKVFCEHCGATPTLRCPYEAISYPSVFPDLQGTKKTDSQSDPKLIEVGPASIAAADNYGEWLLAQSRTISADFDLDF